MIPNLIFILYLFGWAKVIQLGIEASDYIISAAMLLPFLAIIVPVLIFGLRLPPSYLVASTNSIAHARVPVVLLGSLFSAIPVFYLVLFESLSLVSIALSFGSVIIGSCLVVYAHKHKVKPKVLI